MALATTCPQCKTSFKVVPDQLKLRRGLVRCGVCQHVFSGIDHLRYVDDTARAAQRQARAASPEPAASESGGPGRPPGMVGGPPPTGSVPPAPSTPMRFEPPTQAGGTVPPTRPRSGAAVREPAPTDGAHDAARPPGPRMSPGSSVPAASSEPPAPAGRPAVATPSHSAAPLPPPAPWAPPGPLAPAGPTPAALPERRRAPPDAPAPWQADVPPTASSPRPMPSPAVGSAALERAPVAPPGSPPALPWSNTVAGLRTVIDGGEDLKTAFFLTDSAFGPLPGEVEGASSGPAAHRPAGRVDPYRPEQPPMPAPGPVPAADPDAPLTVALPLRPEAPPLEGFLTDPPSAPEPEPAPIVAGAPYRPRLRDAGPLAPEPAESAIDYFAPQRSRSRSFGLALSPIAWAVAAVLALLLAGQAIVGWRDSLAARVPWLGPVLAAAVSPLGLAIGPPREIGSLTIESFELQAASVPNLLQLQAVLRNRSGHVVGFPAMELTLTDSVGEVLLRKVIPAQSYLADPARAADGLAARSEWPLRLALEHDGLQPTGYSVALFYP